MYLAIRAESPARGGNDHEVGREVNFVAESPADDRNPPRNAGSGWAADDSVVDTTSHWRSDHSSEDGQAG
jgi:hypothetical protein